MLSVRSFSIVLVCLVIAFVLNKSENVVCNDLCNFKTDEFITYYGYEAEEHKITTDDGYILTVFRCNSKKSSTKTRKPLIVQHGLLLSSDDFATNMPGQALAYVFADAGYDVFLANARGNAYSRNHTTKNADDPSSGFWKFSWYEIGKYDHPALIDYVLKLTNRSKAYFIGHSQGGASLAILLTERPEYNEKIHVASLLAPAFGLRRVGYFTEAFLIVGKILQFFENSEAFPRSRMNKIISKICTKVPYACNVLVDFIMGPSENQRNDTMLPVHVCHFPSGISANQHLHFTQTILYEYFGKYKHGSNVPPEFPISRITAPISFHLTTSDSLINVEYTTGMASKFQNVVDVQVINESAFNHIDYLWGIHAKSLVYSKILKIFEKFQ
ncbi:lipase 1-like [Sitodiplosis mosellana]|uniref:lipase 1-like n=1 Tax=Sitodiplosis mosellana TaxID=263140 RepID=UPI002444F197|nr:lipase 1-like [Sitodiplosis mosellana]